MLLQELLVMKGIDLSKAKLVRHNMSNDDVRENKRLGYLDIYQSVQKLSKFKNCDYVVGFLGEEGTTATYIGCYKIMDIQPLQRNLLPADYAAQNDIHSECVFFKMKKTDIMAEFENRLVVEWGKGARNWCQNGTIEKEILYVRANIADFGFVSYDRVILSFDELSTIVMNHKQYKTWEDKLSAVAGVYLITDTLTGKHYVGSASGEHGGIWGRWSKYVRTKHGDNVQLIKLIEADPLYCANFQFSILEVFPIKRDIQDVLDSEKLYKDKLLSIRFGLNDN